jgi:hypothetical protein
VRNLKPTLATAVQQRGGGRFDTRREPSWVGTHPVCTEGRAVVGTDGDDDPPVVPTPLKINMYYTDGV